MIISVKLKQIKFIKTGENKMKSKLIILSAVVLMFSASQVFAGGGHDHGEHNETGSKDKGSMMEHKGSKGSIHEGHEGHEEGEEVHSDAMKVGNRICPVSNQFIPEGDEVEYEYEGKIYNLCCKMCAKDFKKNPEKFSKIAEELMLKEHGSTHEKGSTGHDHSQHENDEGESHGEHAHECEGAGCAE